MIGPAGGRVLCIAGMIGWREDRGESGRVLPDACVEQFAQELLTIVAVLRAAGGGPEHLAKLTIFVTDKEEYRAARQDLGAKYREVIGNHYPAMALIEVKGLLEPGARIEIESLAVLPPE